MLVLAPEINCERGRPGWRRPLPHLTLAPPPARGAASSAQTRMSRWLAASLKASFLILDNVANRSSQRRQWLCFSPLNESDDIHPTDFNGQDGSLSRPRPFIEIEVQFDPIIRRK